jgi:hypothetical protein
METKFLLPNKFKLIGWILFIPFSILGLFIIFYDFEFEFLNLKVYAIFSEGPVGNHVIFGSYKDNITDEIVAILFLIGAIMVAFSKEKNEDEFLSRIRLESLLWATIVNYAILIFCLLFFYDFGFMYVMIFNLFTSIILFICRFNFILYRTTKSMNYEK